MAVCGSVWEDAMVRSGLVGILWTGLGWGRDGVGWGRDGVGWVEMG